MTEDLPRCAHCRDYYCAYELKRGLCPDCRKTHTLCDYCDAVTEIASLARTEPEYQACPECAPAVRKELEEARRPVCGWCGLEHFTETPNGVLVCRMCGALPRTAA